MKESDNKNYYTLAKKAAEEGDMKKAMAHLDKCIIWNRYSGKYRLAKKC